jgi:peptide/nickel transport system permease protein
MITTHTAIIWQRLMRSRRVAFGALMLGLLALLGVFAEIIAAPAPVIAAGRHGVALFPAVLHAERFADRSSDDIAEQYAGDLAIWPPVRFGPTTRCPEGPLASASFTHPLGTDAQSHDLLARVVYGARTALGLSLGAVLLSMILGVLLGGLAGTGRGFWSDRLVRLVETVDTFPAIIVVALVRAIEREPSALSLVLAVAAVRWAEVARLVRVEVLRASTEEYATAARALGASPSRVLIRHLLPNAVGPVIVSSVFGVGSIVLLDASIAFLALGAPSYTASWGETLAEGARHPGELGLLFWPGIMLVIAVGASYLLADALRESIDRKG